MESKKHTRLTLVIAGITLLLSSQSFAQNQLLNIRGSKPSELTIQPIQSLFSVGVNADDLKLKQKRMCFIFAPGPFGGGYDPKHPWKPKSISLPGIEQTQSSFAYEASLPVTIDKGVCNYTYAFSRFAVTAKNTPYQFKPIHFQAYDPSNPNHRIVDLNHTKILCSPKTLDCRVSPLHVNNNPTVILIPKNLDNSYNIDLMIE